MTKPVGWVSQQELSGLNTGAVTDIPPQYIQDVLTQIGTPWDATKYSWDPVTRDLIDKSSGGRYSYANIADPSLGSYTVLPYDTTKAGSGGTPVDNPFGVGGQAFYYGPNETQPYFFGSPGGSNELFVSGNPEEISEYQHDARTRGLQGIAQVGALVGGAAALGATPWGGGAAGTGTAAGATTGAATTAATAGGATAAGGAAAATGGTAAGTAAAAGGAAAGAAGAAVAGGGVMSYLPTIIGGAASLLGGKLASDAAGDAVDAQIAAGDRALDYQRESRDLALDIARPQLQASNLALAQMLQMTGQPIPASLQEALTEAGVTDIPAFDVTQDPSYQFRLDESMKALETSAFARGGGMSGGFANQALRYAQDYASTEYSNIYSRLSTVAGYGPTATTTSSNAALNYGANAGNIATDTGEARASGYVAQSNAWQNALDQIAKLPWDQWFPGSQTAAAGG